MYGLRENSRIFPKLLKYCSTFAQNLRQLFWVDICGKSSYNIFYVGLLQFTTYINLEIFFQKWLFLVENSFFFRKIFIFFGRKIFQKEEIFTFQKCIKYEVKNSVYLAEPNLSAKKIIEIIFFRKFIDFLSNFPYFSIFFHNYLYFSRNSYIFENTKIFPIGIYRKI